MNIKKKFCSKCKTSKILEEFGNDKGGKAGRAAECKTCGKIRRDVNRYTPRQFAVNTYYVQEFAGQDDLNSPPAWMPRRTRHLPNGVTAVRELLRHVQTPHLNDLINSTQCRRWPLDLPTPDEYMIPHLSAPTHSHPGTGY